MEAKIMQFRRGRKTFTPRHFLIWIKGSDSREKAEKHIGNNVEWKTPSGKIIKGKISAAHGNKGLVRAIFERGLPGQAITTKAEVKEGSKK